eukprot:gene13704-biopygen11674
MGAQPLAQQRERGRGPSVPDDEALGAMGFGDLTMLAVQCKLPGSLLRDEASAREGLREHRARAPELAALRASSAAASAGALCGDFGSAQQQRYMIIGGVSSLVAVLERVATRWGAALLVDAAVRMDAEMEWSCRRRGAAVYPKRGGDEPVHLWEVTGEREVEDDPNSSHPKEWMYEIARRADVWDEHNDAVLLSMRFERDVLRSLGVSVWDLTFYISGGYCIPNNPAPLKGVRRPGLPAGGTPATPRRRRTAPPRRPAPSGGRDAGICSGLDT